MKLFAPRFLVRLLVVLLASIFPLSANTPTSPWYVPPKPGTDPLYDEATLKRLNALIVNVRWDKIDVEAALKDLAAKSRQADPDHLGIKFSLSLPTDTKKTDYRGLTINRQIHILLDKTSIMDALGYVCSQTNLSMKVHKDSVILMPFDPKDAQRANSGEE